MALLDPLFKIAAICSSRGVEEAVIAPGSRSASLTLAFARNNKINTRVISDEKSAGFVALGIAQASRKPVVLICTSGTAALNFAPAVAEAYFQKIPLLVLTADRPPEWIHQHDGQTVFQSGIYGSHILKSYDFPVDYSHPDAVWQIQRDTHEALAICKDGPVHINVPIREPFYPEEGEQFDGNFRTVLYTEGSKSLNEDTWANLIKAWDEAKDIVIAVGQNHQNLDPYLDQLSRLAKVSIWSDVISNVGIKKRIRTQDLFLAKVESKKMDLLITLGQSFISKSFKLYFRKNRVAVHWQVGKEIEMIDALQSIDHKILVDEVYFLKELVSRINMDGGKPRNHWEDVEKDSRDKLKQFLSKADWGELTATYSILKNLKSGDILNLGNSMPVRYGNYLHAFLPEGITVYANRGTSGIEGVLSTAAGHATQSKSRVHCIIGDVSFFYDSNALFAQKLENLSVYVMNNAGGNIFRVIDGPSRQPELETYFLTDTGRTAKRIAEDAGYIYYGIHKKADFVSALSQAKNGKVVYEFFLDGKRDVDLLKVLKSSI